MSLCFPKTEARFLRYLATGGNEDGQMIDPQGISVSDEGNITVCDRKNKRIQVFSPDGEMIFKFSDDGDDERREVDNPKACVYYKDHYIVAVFFKRFSSSITLYDKNGQFVRRFRDPDKSLQENFRPYDLALTKCDNLIVTDCGNHRLVLFGLDGSILATVGTKGANLGQLSWPLGVATLGDNTVMVCEHCNDRLQVFKLKHSKSTS